MYICTWDPRRSLIFWGSTTDRRAQIRNQSLLPEQFSQLQQQQQQRQLTPIIKCKLSTTITTTTTRMRPVYGACLQQKKPKKQNKRKSFRFLQFFLLSFLCCRLSSKTHSNNNRNNNNRNNSNLCRYAVGSRIFWLRHFQVRLLGHGQLKSKRGKHKRDNTRWGSSGKSNGKYPREEAECRQMRMGNYRQSVWYRQRLK